MKIGYKIKKIRDLRGIKQDDIAEQLGISQEHYSKIEANKTNLSMPKLEKIAKILEVNPTDLIDFDESKVLNINNHKATQIGYYNEIETVKQAYEKAIEQSRVNAEQLKTLYEKIIEQQKEEIAFLRNLLNNK
jgi:transcriptional regulator with XRE-family HTH domain